MKTIYFKVPQKKLSEMSDIELIKCISNLMTKRSEIIESINNDLKKEIKLLRKENDVLRRLYNLKAGE